MDIDETNGRGAAPTDSRVRRRILPIRRSEAAQAALLRAQSRRLGRVLHLADALIAGTANAHGLAVATRNAGDFDYLDVAVINPWEPEQAE